MLIDYLLKGTSPKWSYWFCNVRYGVRLWPVISQKWRWCSGRYNKQTLASITWWLRMTLAHQRSPLYYMQPTTVHTRGKHQLAEWNNCNSCLLSLLIVSTIHTIVHLLSWAALEEIFFKNCNIAAISVKTKRLFINPSVRWCCCLGELKGILPIKLKSHFINTGATG